MRDELPLEPVKELVDALFARDARATNNEEQDLADLLSHEHVIPVELAARILGQSAERLLEIGRRASSHCLVLEGPPALLLDVAGVPPQAEVVS
jgi:hypothetical protein